MGKIAVMGGEDVDGIAAFSQVGADIGDHLPAASADGWEFVRNDQDLHGSGQRLTTGLFRVAVQDFTDDVNRFLLGFVIRTRQQLGHQAHQNGLKAHHGQHNRDDEERRGKGGGFVGRHEAADAQE